MKFHFFIHVFFITNTYASIFSKILKMLPQKQVIPDKPEIKNVIEISPREQYDMSWYVVAESSSIKKNEPYKVTVWDKDYVLWKSSDGLYEALDDTCPHRGASLSLGIINNNRIMCPYHGYEFSHIGNLTIVPGLCFTESHQYNVARFSVVEKHGWIYLNTYQIPHFVNKFQLDELNSNIFIEPEATDNSMSVVLINKMFNSYPRVVSENSLDIMHIAYVHTFGNKNKPAPSYEDPPKQISIGHWRTSYIYESGAKSMVSKVFNIKKIDIDNEFALPHTTIARIKFGDDLINTIVTAACPINNKTTKLFVKTYRNFFTEPLFDGIFRNMMIETLNQDKAIIESIKLENVDGKFNMKFDKLQNTYKTFYTKIVKKLP